MNTKRHVGPPLVIVGAVFVALFLAGLALSLILDGRAYPTVVDGFFQFGAAIPLAIYTATVVSRLQFHGIRAPGVLIAQIGGTLASALLALSGLLQWTVAQHTDAALSDLTFAVGGVAHVATLGLLIAGIAVTSGFARLIPQWMVWFGLIVAVIAELSTVSLLVPALSVSLPLARFPAFVWLVIVAVLLPKTRTDDVAT